MDFDTKFRMLSCETAARFSNSRSCCGDSCDVHLLRALAVVSPPLDLGARLAGDEASAAEGAHGISGGGALDAVPLPGLLPQDEDGDAGEEAAEEAPQPTALAHVISVAFDETARDARAAYA